MDLTCVINDWLPSLMCILSANLSLRSLLQLTTIQYFGFLKAPVWADILHNMFQ